MQSPQTWIDRRAVSVESVCVPTMNFGQFQRWRPDARVGYVLRVPLPRVLPWLDERLEQLRREEAEEEDDPDFSVLLRYRRLGMPSITGLREQHPALLGQLVVAWFDYDLLHELLSTSPMPERLQWSLQSVDRARLEAGHLVLEGAAWPVKVQEMNE